MAAAILIAVGRDRVIPSLVLAETDYPLRTRVSVPSARLLLGAVASVEHSAAYMTIELLRRATEIDEQDGDLDLGFADASVMAVTARDHAPVMTFDFEDFRGPLPTRAPGRSSVDESRYLESIR